MDEMHASDSQLDTQFKEMLPLDVWNPLSLIPAVVLIVVSFVLGLYLETSETQYALSLGTYHLRNSLGIILCSLTSLFFLSLSIVLLAIRWKDQFWGITDWRLFFLAMMLTSLYQATALEFLLYGELNYPHVWTLTYAKWIIILSAIYGVFRLLEVLLNKHDTQSEMESGDTNPDTPPLD